MKTAIKGKAGTQFMNRNEDYRQGFRFSESQRWKAATKASKVYPFIDRFSKNDYVLDIGCGVGIELNITSTKADFSVGTDIDVKNLITARSFLKQKSKIDFVRADIHFLPFKDEAFSKILCFDVIEHLRFPDRAVKEISRIVKTDGEGYIRLPNKWTVHEGLLRILALSKPSKGLWNVRHVSFFSLKDIIHLFSRHGFSYLDGYTKGDLRYNLKVSILAIASVFVNGFVVLLGGQYYKVRYYSNALNSSHQKTKIYSYKPNFENMPLFSDYLVVFKRIA